MPRGSLTRFALARPKKTSRSASSAHTLRLLPGILPAARFSTTSTRYRSTNFFSASFCCLGGYTKQEQNDELVDCLCTFLFHIGKCATKCGILDRCKNYTHQPKSFMNDRSMLYVIIRSIPARMPDAMQATQNAYRPSILALQLSSLCLFRPPRCDAVAMPEIFAHGGIFDRR